MDEVKRGGRRKGFTRVSSTNQVTLPIDVLASAGVRPGDSLTVEAKTTGEIVLRREVDPHDGARVKLPDALIIATAMVVRADRIVTADAGWPALDVPVTVLGAA